MTDPPDHPRSLDDVVTQTRRGVVIRVRVQPRASRTAVLGLSGDELRIAVGPPPEGGRATEAARRTLARWLGVPAARVSLASGETSRSKGFAVAGIGLGEVRSLVSQRLGSPDRRAP